jgi:hypothetical protein
MRTTLVTGVLIGVTAFYWVRSTAGQVQPVPGFGTGTVTVQGEVDIRKLPPIDVGQRGDWKVSLANVADVRVVNTPAVAIALPPFLRTGGRYEVTWPAGDRETFAIAQLGGGTWVRTAGDGRPRWLNLAAARTIEEMP